MSESAVASFSPKTILCVVAHPDDIEYCVGGSLARWIAEGATVHYFILTDGSKGSSDRSLSAHDIASTRQKEQRAAAKLLGISNIFFGDYQDCNLTVTSNVKRDIVRIIRKIRPDTVITMDPTMFYSVKRSEINHADHRAAGQAVLDAVFPLARDYFAFPELVDKEKLEPHNVATLLLINYDVSNFYVDITDTLDAKLEALTAHVSQFSDMAGIQQIVRNHAETAGHNHGCAYAEEFIRLDIPG